MGVSLQFVNSSAYGKEEFRKTIEGMASNRNRPHNLIFDKVMMTTFFAAISLLCIFMCKI
jgi:hypothetical protein